MGVLKVRVNGVWEDVGTITQEPPLDEVWIGPDPPDPAGTWETWFDTSMVPATIKYRDATSAWTEAGTSEVEIGVEDPYVVNPTSRAEIWHDLSIGQSGKMKARVGGQWIPVAEFTESEVEIGSTDPVTIPGGPQPGTTELWVDTATSPAVMKAWVNGGWVAVGGATLPAAPQEVEIGPADPRDATVELWYDTTNSPLGTLFANNNGVWEPVGGANEVTVSAEDPYQTNPQSADELWYSLLDTTLKVRVADQWVSIQGQKPGTPAPQREYGKPPAIGISQDYARADHEHGTVPEEVYVGTEDPTLPAMGLDPAAPQADLWYDVDAVPVTTVMSTNIAVLTQRITELEAAVRRLGGMA